MTQEGMEIKEMVDRETRGWDTQDAELLTALFHPDMVWPWPRTSSRTIPLPALRPETDGSYSVAGVVERDGKPLVAGVQAGDRLLAVDGLEVMGAAMGRVIKALRGRPGESRRLLL